jgi:hypothetical protein
VAGAQWWVLVKFYPGKGGSLIGPFATRTAAAQEAAQIRRRADVHSAKVVRKRG